MRRAMFQAAAQTRKDYRKHQCGGRIRRANNQTVVGRNDNWSRAPVGRCGQAKILCRMRFSAGSGACDRLNFKRCVEPCPQHLPFLCTTSEGGNLCHHGFAELFVAPRTMFRGYEILVIVTLFLTLQTHCW